MCFSRNFANRGEIFLSYRHEENWQFELGPLFKCQSMENNGVRSGEEYSIMPLVSGQESEKIGMVAGKN